MKVLNFNDNNSLNSFGKISNKQMSEQNINSDYMAHLCHEIRSPANGILGITELLKDTLLHDDQYELVGMLDRSTTHLLNVINEFLDYSKLNAKKVQLESTCFNADEVIDDIKVIITPQILVKPELSLRIIKNPNFPKTLYGDPTRFKQVVINLLANAIKFTARGLVSLYLHSFDSTHIKVVVKDTGMGIRKEQAGKIFRPYAQAEEGTSSGFGGTGLGLVICKLLVEQMDGEVGFSSRFGYGSTFWFTAKLARI